MTNKTIAAMTAAFLALSSSLAFAGTDAVKPVAAAPSSQQAPLAPGAAAGTQTAQSFAGVPILYVGLGVLVVGGGIALIASNNGGHGSTSTTGTGAGP